MSWEFERVAGPFGFTEGPAWDGSRLLFSDIPNSRVLAYDPDTDKTSIFRRKTNHANGLKFGPDGHLYACETSGRRIVHYNETTQVVVDRYDGDRLNSPNDLAFDKSGCLWFTDPRYQNNAADLEEPLELDHESVYRAEPRTNYWELFRVTDDTTKPNGILVSRDQRQLFVAQTDPSETGKRELRSYPIDDDGSLGSHTVLHNFFPHRGIDGMCLDADGNIIATAGSAESGPGPLLYIFTPRGRVLETHPFPGNLPTNCTFGDEDLRTLYVTGDGCLFRARTDRTGYLTPP